VLPPAPDALADAHRIAAARRLLLEVSGPAAYDRLSGLAARLLGAGHAKVTLFTDQDTVVGGHRLPPGVVGGRALLTGAFSACVVREGRALVVPDARADGRLSELPAVTSGEVAAYLGSPLISASGRVVGVLAVYDPQPRTWQDDDAALLEHLAASVVAELELAAARSAIGASRVRLEVALEAGAIGIWEHDLRTRVLHWDERCAAIHGLAGPLQIDDVDTMIADRIHPDDHDAVRRAMTDALAGTGEYLVEARSIHTDGTVRWTVSRGRVVRDPRGAAVRVLGTVVDVTDAREQAARRMAAVQRAAAVAEVAAELANATALSQLAEIALPGSSPTPSRRPPPRPRWRRPRRGWRSSSTTSCPPSTPPGTASGSCSPTSTTPSPGSPAWPRSAPPWGCAPWPPCRCGWRAGRSAASSSSGTPSTPSRTPTSSSSTR
jgi:PAS domain S-box-containing protein